MKKLIMLTLVSTMALSSIGCSGITESKKVNKNDTPTETKLDKQTSYGLVLEVVSFDKENKILSASELNNTGIVDYTISMQENSTVDLSLYKVGDKIAVDTDLIMESYPAQVIAIDVVKASDEKIKSHMNNITSSISAEPVSFQVVNQADLPNKINDLIMQNNATEGYDIIKDNNKTYLAIYMGQQNTGGYANQVTDLLKIDDTFVVYVNETSPGPDDMVTMAITYPYVVIQVDATEGITKDNTSLEIYNHVTDNGSIDIPTHDLNDLSNTETNSNYYIEPLDQYKEGETFAGGELIQIDGDYIHIMSGDLIQVYQGNPEDYKNFYIGESIELIKSEESFKIKSLIRDDFSVNHTNMGHIITPVTGTVTSITGDVFELETEAGKTITLSGSEYLDLTIGEEMTIEYISFDGKEKLATLALNAKDLIGIKVESIKRLDTGSMLIEGCQLTKSNQKYDVIIASSTSIHLNLSEIKVGDEIKIYADQIIDSFPMTVTPQRVFK